MARLAIVTSPAVLFVGPPGTGKNRLLAEILSEIDDDPASYGFQNGHEVVIEPAEEGWTTRDLVGGETIDEQTGLLRFRPGRVLDAVANNRWIVIDEANRADLDRIFGGLLTWLSGQQVVVGRASTKVGAPLVRLGWTDDPNSSADGADRLSAHDVGTEPIDYWAGTEFRLLGTYNALDAQRVFRFGLALGRRFAQVPVPPAAVSDFEVLLGAQTATLDEKLRDRAVPTIVALYRGHLETRGAQLGPAMFLGLAEYIAKGLELSDLGIVDHEDEDEIDRLLAEAYLLSAGVWLARLDPHSELPALAARLTDSHEGALSPDQWNWVAGQLETIGG
jgi:MoxR-like ATPase